MIRPASLALVALAVTLLAAPQAEAKKKFGFGGISIDLPGQVGGGGGRVPPITLPKPPIVCPKPPVIPPIIRPPVRPPVWPPIVCPKPPIVCPPVHPPIHPPVVPPIICPPKPPIVCPKPPIVCPPKPPVVVCPPTPPVVQPICYKPPCTCEHWYFGMSLERVQTQYGIGLQVASITPGAPSANAGLEAGDILLVAGTTSLSQSQSNEHGVQLVQSAVVDPGQVTLTVLDRRTGQATYVSVLPQNLGGGSATPIATAPVPTATL